VNFYLGFFEIKEYNFKQKEEFGPAIEWAWPVALSDGAGVGLLGAFFPCLSRKTCCMSSCDLMLHVLTISVSNKFSCCQTKKSDVNFLQNENFLRAEEVIRAIRSGLNMPCNICRATSCKKMFKCNMFCSKSVGRCLWRPHSRLVRRSGRSSLFNCRTELFRKNFLPCLCATAHGL